MDGTTWERASQAVPKQGTDVRRVVGTGFLRRLSTILLFTNLQKTFLITIVMEHREDCRVSVPTAPTGSPRSHPEGWTAQLGRRLGDPAFGAARPGHLGGVGRRTPGHAPIRGAVRAPSYGSVPGGCP